MRVFKPRSKTGGKSDDAEGAGQSPSPNPDSRTWAEVLRQQVESAVAGRHPATTSWASSSGTGPSQQGTTAQHDVAKQVSAGNDVVGGNGISEHDEKSVSDSDHLNHDGIVPGLNFYNSATGFKSQEDLMLSPSVDVDNDTQEENPPSPEYNPVDHMPTTPVHRMIRLNPSYTATAAAYTNPSLWNLSVFASEPPARVGLESLFESVLEHEYNYGYGGAGTVTANHTSTASATAALLDNAHVAAAGPSRGPFVGPAMQAHDNGGPSRANAGPGPGHDETGIPPFPRDLSPEQHTLAIEAAPGPVERTIPPFPYEGVPPVPYEEQVPRELGEGAYGDAGYGANAYYGGYDGTINTNAMAAQPGYGYHHPQQAFYPQPAMYPQPMGYHQPPVFQPPNFYQYPAPYSHQEYYPHHSFMPQQAIPPHAVPSFIGQPNYFGMAPAQATQEYYQPLGFDPAPPQPGFSAPLPVELAHHDSHQLAVEEARPARSDVRSRPSSTGDRSNYPQYRLYSNNNRQRYQPVLRNTRSPFLTSSPEATALTQSGVSASPHPNPPAGVTGGDGNKKDNEDDVDDDNNNNTDGSTADEFGWTHNNFVLSRPQDLKLIESSEDSGDESFEDSEDEEQDSDQEDGTDQENGMALILASSSDETPRPAHAQQRRTSSMAIKPGRHRPEPTGCIVNDDFSWSCWVTPDNKTSNMLRALIDTETGLPTIQKALHASIYPFSEGVRHTMPLGRRGVIRLDNVPPGVSRAEILAYVRCARLNDADEPVHIIMHRTTKRATKAFVEFASDYEARSVFKRLQYNPKNRSFFPKIGDNRIDVNMSNESELMAALFPSARGVRWNNSHPAVLQDTRYASENFRGIVTAEEMVVLSKSAEWALRPGEGMVVEFSSKYKKRNQDAGFKERRPERAFETLISTIGHFPFFAANYVTVDQRAAMYNAAMDMIINLKEAIKGRPGGPCPVTGKHLIAKKCIQPGLAKELIHRLTRAVARCPGFSVVQRSSILSVGETDPHGVDTVGVPLPRNPPAATWTQLQALIPKPMVPADVMTFYVEMIRRSTEREASFLPYRERAHLEAVKAAGGAPQWGFFFAKFPVMEGEGIGKLTLAELARREHDTIKEVLRNALADPCLLIDPIPFADAAAAA